MTNMTLSLPEELLKRMKRFREVRWSEVARQAIEKRVSDFEEMERAVSKSKLTKEDAKEIATLVNTSLAKRLKIG